MSSRWWVGLILAILLAATPAQSAFAASSLVAPNAGALVVEQQAAPVATLQASGWATVTRVSGPDSLRVRNDRGQAFSVWHIGIIGPHEGQLDWRERAIADHAALLPAGARVWLEAEPGIESGTTGVALRHVFTQDDQRVPVAAKLLAAGSVWVFPDGLHALHESFADRQAQAVLEGAGAWAETRSSQVFRPRDVAWGGYPIDPQVRSVLEALDATPVGHEILVAVNRFPPEIGVSNRPVDVLGSFSRREYSIQLAPEIMTASPQSVSAVLLHELVHARQMIDQQVDGAELTCFEREEQAFEAQAEFWIGLHGPRGRVGAVHSLERNLNGLALSHSRGQLNGWVRENYADQCRD